MMYVNEKRFTSIQFYPFWIREFFRSALLNFEYYWDRFWNFEFWRVTTWNWIWTMKQKNGKPSIIFIGKVALHWAYTLKNATLQKVAIVPFLAPDWNLNQHCGKWYYSSLIKELNTLFVVFLVFFQGQVHLMILGLNNREIWMELRKESTWSTKTNILGAEMSGFWPDLEDSCCLWLSLRSCHDPG